MYCSSCGTAAKPGLSYCNRCGAELSAKGSGAGMSETLPESLVWAIVSVTVAGLGVIIGLMAVMKEVLNLKEDLIVAFTLLSFLMVIAADSVLIWMLVRSKIGAKGAGEMPQQKGLDASSHGAGRALPEPAPSVTEHTTRTLEAAEANRRAE